MESYKSHSDVLLVIQKKRPLEIKVLTEQQEDSKKEGTPNPPMTGGKNAEGSHNAEGSRNVGMSEGTLHNKTQSLSLEGLHNANTNTGSLSDLMPESGSESQPGSHTGSQTGSETGSQTGSQTSWSESQTGSTGSENPEAHWFYEDDDGNKQGPFADTKMAKWFGQGDFEADLKV